MREVRLPLLPAWFRWLGVSAAATVILVFSVLLTLPSGVDTEPFSFVPLDKWRHFLAYAAFGGALAYATTDWEWSTGRLAILVLGVTVGFGIGIELWQGFLPARHFSFLDAYANALGAVLVSPWYLLRSRVAFVSLRTWITNVTD